MNKQIKTTTDNVEKQYDSHQYLEAMKRFQMKTKGMLPNSPEWNMIRNETYAELRDQKAAETEALLHESRQTVAEPGQITDFSSYYNLIIVNHEQAASYETLNILNYFGFPINVEEEDFWQGSRKDFQFSKHDEYPFLVINSSHEEMPGCELSGREPILSWLFNKSLIGAYRNYSPYER